MKRLILIAAAAVVTLSTTSCKKSYHCECTFGNFTSKDASVEYTRKEAEDARKACEAKSNSVLGVTCKLVED